MGFSAGGLGKSWPRCVQIVGGFVSVAFAGEVAGTVRQWGSWGLWYISFSLGCLVKKIILLIGLCEDFRNDALMTGMNCSLGCVLV